jgi:hypothetical protein
MTSEEQIKHALKSPYNVHPIRPGQLTRSRLISIPLNVNQSQGFLKFPNQNDLIGMRITRIQLNTSVQLGADPNNNGSGVLGLDQCVNATMTLNMYDPDSESASVPGQAGEWIENYPLLGLYDYVDGENIYQRHPTLLPGVCLIWESCKINIIAPMTNAANTSICLNFWYTSSNYNQYDHRKGTFGVYN